MSYQNFFCTFTLLFLSLSPKSRAVRAAFLLQTEEVDDLDD